MKVLITIACILTGLAAISPPAPAFGQDKVVLYYFKDLSPSTDYSYYSYIIPDSIAVDLKRTKRYTVMSFPVSIETAPRSLPTAVRQERIRMLAQKGREFSADYIICGNYHVKNRRIVIDAQIFIVSKQEITEVSETSTELGTMLFSMIDTITKKINSELERSKPERSAATTVDASSSPFYNALRGITVGMNYGTIKFQDPWSRYYDTAPMVSCYLYYDLSNIAAIKPVPVLSDIAVSSEFTYFNSITTAAKSDYLNSWGALVNLSYQIRFAGFLTIAITAGCGEAQTTYSTYRNFSSSESKNNGPFNSPAQKKSSTDIYAATGMTMHLEFDPLVINSGVSFRRIYNAQDPITFSVVFFGLGYRI